MCCIFNWCKKKPLSPKTDDKQDNSIPEKEKEEIEVKPKPETQLTTLEKEYVYMWETCEVTQSVAWYTNKIIPNISRYRFVENKTGVPWWIVACIHAREASCNFSKNLMNGQRLDQVTTWVPKGYGPWSTWEDSAIDALKHDRFTGVTDWLKIHVVLKKLEQYNGWGYQNRCARAEKEIERLASLNYESQSDATKKKIKAAWNAQNALSKKRFGDYYEILAYNFDATCSPYLWCFTNHYRRGGYPRDHVFSATYINKSAGVAAILKELIKKDHIKVNFTK